MTAAFRAGNIDLALLLLKSGASPQCLLRWGAALTYLGTWSSSSLDRLSGLLDSAGADVAGLVGDDVAAMTLLHYASLGGVRQTLKR